MNLHPVINAPRRPVPTFTPPGLWAVTVKAERTETGWAGFVTKVGAALPLKLNVATFNSVSYDGLIGDVVNELEESAKLPDGSVVHFVDRVTFSVVGIKLESSPFIGQVRLTVAKTDTGQWLGTCQKGGAFLAPSFGAAGEGSETVRYAAALWYASQYDVSSVTVSTFHTHVFLG